jgi:hypothetical protein
MKKLINDTVVDNYMAQFTDSMKSDISEKYFEADLIEPSVKQFIEHIPNCISGVNNKVYDVNTFKEVLDIPFVRKFSEIANFYSYAISVDTEPYKLTLMSMSNWVEEYNGCTSWWVIGYLPGFIMYETELKNWLDIKAEHKPNCWMRKYNSISDLLGFDRPIENRMKILKEVGWNKNDTYGVANYCDCGWKEFNENRK